MAGSVRTAFVFTLSAALGVTALATGACCTTRSTGDSFKFLAKCRTMNRSLMPSPLAAKRWRIVTAAFDMDSGRHDYRVMGRPRQFDHDDVLEAAMEAFWARGFESTSLGTLTAATGLNRPSLYNAFGSKLGLFCAVLDYYRNGPGAHITGPLVQRRGADALRTFLDRLSGFVQTAKGRYGCLLINTSLEAISREAEVRDRLDTHFIGVETAIANVYRQAQAAGSVSAQLDPAVVACWTLAFARGVLVSASSGEQADKLVRSIALTQAYLGIA